nr:hypothetical protein [Candidatus Sigynarchaeum springense]
MKTADHEPAAPGNQHAADRAGHRVPTDRAQALAVVGGGDLLPIRARSARTGSRGSDLTRLGSVARGTPFVRWECLLRGSTGRVLARARGRIDRRGSSIAAIGQCLEPALVRGMPLHAGRRGSAKAGYPCGIDPRVGKIVAVERCREPARPRVGARLATLSTGNLSVDAMGIDHAVVRIAGGSADFAPIKQNI